MKRARPFLKWVGGKRQLLPQLLEHVPASYGTYFEPFVGGGALFFALCPERAVLNDLNSRLANAYVCVRDDLQGVVAALRVLERSSTVFHAQRELLNAEDASEIGTIEAARFIYLNKTCFNGLWRENAAGAFNVPYGGDRPGKLFDESLLMTCSIALRGRAQITGLDFEAAVQDAVEGDLVYLDPPYIPLKLDSFVDYTADGFGPKEHVRLRDLARELKSRGVHVIVSNSDTPLARDLYAGFALREVQARRSVNRDGAKRGRVGELIIT